MKCGTCSGTGTHERPGYWDGAAECPECEGVGIAPTPPIFVRFSDDGQHIRKWSFEPFEHATRYAPTFEPSWNNPDGPQAA